MNKGELRECTKLLIQNAFANLQDAEKCNVKYSEFVRKIDCLFETEFEKPDFLVRLGFLLVEVGLYPGRFQAKTD